MAAGAHSKPRSRANPAESLGRRVISYELIAGCASSSGRPWRWMWSGSRYSAVMLKARDVMTKDVVTVKKDLPIRALIAKLRETRFSGFPVVDDAGRAIGLVSQNDVLRGLAWMLGPGSPAL